MCFSYCEEQAMGLLGECAAGKGEARLEKGEPPATACQPWPPSSSGFPPESCQEPHCFVPLAQDLRFCYNELMQSMAKRQAGWHWWQCRCKRARPKYRYVLHGLKSLCK